MANSAQYDVIINVITGHLEKATKQLRGMASATDGVAASQTKAAKAGKAHNDIVNGGVASANNSGRAMSKLIDTATGGNGLVAAYATLATNAFAVSAAFNALRNAAQVQQLMEGLAVQGSRTGRTLSLVSNSVLEITKNSISAADAMKATSQGFSAGLNTKDIEALTKVATNASIALGRNLPDSMDRVIKGVTKLEPELLDELGLMTKLTEATENYARAQGKSVSDLSALEKRRAFVEAIKKEGEFKFGGISEEVDVNRFDQLAATFQNLTNETLGWVAASAPINGILSILIDTTYGLTGALAIFGSLIGKQVTNWLQGLAVSAAAAAAALNKQAVAQRNAANAALQASKVKVSTAESGVATAVGLSKKMPERYKEMLASREKGTLTAEQQEAGLKSLENSTKTYQGKLDKLTESTEVNTAATQKKINAIKEEIAANTLRIASEKELAAAQTYAAKRQFTNIARTERASAAQYATIKESRAATALESAAGFTTIPKAFSAGLQSIVAYKNELNATKLATLATASAMGKSIPVFGMVAPVANTAKVALYGFRLGIQAVSTSLMTVLPWIGIITLLASVAEELYNTFFVTEAEKVKKKALEELGTVLDNTANHIKEVTRVSKLDIQEGLKYSKMAEIKINSLLEIADAYIKVSDATQLAIDNELKAAAAREKLKTTPLEGSMTEAEKKLLIPEAAQNRLDALAKRQSIASAAGVSLDSKAIDAFSDSLKNNGYIFDDWDKEGIEAIRTIDQISKLSPELAKGFFDAAKGAKTQEQSIALLNKTLRFARSEYSPVRDKILEFTEALKAAENVQTDFLKSLKPTTEFDSALSGFRGLSGAMNDLNKLMSSQEGLASKDLTGSFEKIITQIGPNISTALDAGAQSTLSSYNAVGAQINRINKELEEARSKKQSTVALEKELNDATKQRSLYEAYLGKEIPKQIDGYTEMLALAQQQSIVAQSQVTLAQARLSVIQRQGTVTGADVRRQMEAQNAVLAAQQAQEKVKLAFIKLDIDKLNITIQEIKAQQELLELLKKQRNAQDQITESQLLKTIRAEREALMLKGQTGSARYIALGAQEQELVKPKDQRKSEEQAARERRQAEQSRATLEAGAAAASNAVAALSMQMNTAAEIATAEAKQNLAVEKEKYDLLRTTLDTSKDRLQVERQITNVLIGSKNVLKDELTAIEENSKARLEASSKEYNFRKRSLLLDLSLAKARGLTNQQQYYKDILKLEEDKYNSQQGLLESQRDLEVLNKIAIKSDEDLISKKQEVLSYNQKIAESIQEQASATRGLFEASVDLSAKVRGVTDTEATQQLKSIKAAQDAYDLAVSEATIKKAQIDLEFLLLKSKREQTLLEIEQGKVALAGLKERTEERLKYARAELQKSKDNVKQKKGGSGYDGSIVVTADQIEKDPNVATNAKIVTQLETSLSSFDKQNGYLDELTTAWGKVNKDALDNIPTALKDALDKGSQTAAKRLQEALAQGPMTKGGLVEDYQNQQERGAVVKARMDATALEAGVKARNAERAARNEVALTTEEIKQQKAELIALGAEKEKSAIKGMAVEFVAREVMSFGEKTAAAMEALGPEGAITAAVIRGASSMTGAFMDFSKTLKNAKSDSDVWVAGLQLVAQAISAVSSILKAASDAKIAGIDKEIDAEQKRDGKSAASVEKIKAMEKKKDDIARKSFETQKKLQMASVVVNTAAAAIGIAASLSSLGPAAIALIPVAVGMITALGAAQLALIAGTSYQGSPSSVDAASMPSNLSIGKRGDTVDLAKGPNASAGGEVGYLRGASGQGSNASNYRTVGSAYGGELMRGYGNRGFVVGEKGPEVITPETPISVTPANDVGMAQPINANFTIQALDSNGVQDILVSQKGNIIKMLREAANASGKTFMEDVNVNVYTRPSVGKL